MRLRRGLGSRVVGAGSHVGVLLTALLCAGSGVLQALDGSAALGAGLLFVSAGLAAFWLRAVTAWAEFDEAGVRWRQLVRQDHPWDQIAGIDLTSQRSLTEDSGFPAIVVRWRASGDAPADSGDIRPARSGGRHRREFGQALLEAAAQHGKRTRIRSSDWGLPMSDPDPAGWG